MYKSGISKNDTLSAMVLACAKRDVVATLRLPHANIP